MLCKLVKDANPVGQPYDVLDEQIVILKQEWDASKVEEPRKWWEFWKVGSVMEVVSYLTNCLDKFITAIDGFSDLSSEDKKATVLRAIGKIYDYIVREAMPFWLKPISGKIKHFIINVVISYAIDFIVGKYHALEWRDTNEVEPEGGATE
jgi:hypothetical protein